MKSIRPRRADLQLLKLSPEEGFVLSRVIGPLSLRELVAISGLEEARVTEIVERLAAAGAIEVDGGPAPTTAEFPAPARAPVPSFAGIDELDDLGIDDAPLSGPSSLEVFGVTDVGRVRSNNEDALAIVDLADGTSFVDARTKVELAVGERGALLAVADGMGGENAGEVASRIVVETVREHLSRQEAIVDPADTLRAAVDEANAKIIAAATASEVQGMGTTLVAVLVRGAVAYTAEVGDSRAYVLRDGTLTQITKDQTYTALLIEQGVLTAEAAKTSKAKNVVLQACGKSATLVVAQRRVELRLADILLLCSDGLTGQVADDEIASILAGAGSSLDEACASLVAKANERGGVDNVTVVAARVAGSAPGLRDGESVAETITVLRPFSFAV